MGALGIITCETMELEFAWLLVRDPGIAQITVIENAVSARLIRSLRKGNMQNVSRIPHVSSFRPEASERTEVLVRVMDLTLHGRRSSLLAAVRAASTEMAPRVDALLLGYGLCGNALMHLREALDVEVPVFLPMDNDHPVDDCVALALGGRERYQAERRDAPGTFYMTAGWACHWRKVFGREMGGQDPTMLKRVFAGYTRSLLVVTPVMSEDEMMRRAGPFHRALGLHVETCAGTLELLTRAWHSAVAYVCAVDRAVDRGSGVTACN